MAAARYAGDETWDDAHSWLLATDGRNSAPKKPWHESKVMAATIVSKRQSGAEFRPSTVISRDLILGGVLGGGRPSYVGSKTLLEH